MNDFSENSDEEKMYYVLYHAFLAFQDRINHLHNILHKPDNDDEYIQYCKKKIDEHESALKFISKRLESYFLEICRDHESEDYELRR